MSEIQITITDIQNKAGQPVKVLKFTGQLDETNVDEKSKIIYDLLTATPKNLNMIFDFAELDYMNSKSVGYLTDWYTKVSNTGGGIVIVGAKPNIQDILEVVGLTQIIKFVGTMEEAESFTFGAQAQPEQAAQPVTTTPAAPAAPIAQAPAQPVIQQPAQPVEAPQVTQQPAIQPTTAVQPVEPAPQVTPAPEPVAPTPQATAPAPAAPATAPAPEATPAPTTQPNVEIIFNAQTPPPLK